MTRKQQILTGMPVDVRGWRLRARLSGGSITRTNGTNISERRRTDAFNMGCVTTALEEAVIGADVRAQGKLH